MALCSFAVKTLSNAYYRLSVASLFFRHSDRRFSVLQGFAVKTFTNAYCHLSVTSLRSDIHKAPLDFARLYLNLLTLFFFLREAALFSVVFSVLKDE